jgi:hypothetical protein
MHQSKLFLQRTTATLLTVSTVRGFPGRNGFRASDRSRPDQRSSAGREHRSLFEEQENTSRHVRGSVGFGLYASGFAGASASTYLQRSGDSEADPQQAAGRAPRTSRSDDWVGRAGRPVSSCDHRSTQQLAARHGYRCGHFRGCAEIF